MANSKIMTSSAITYLSFEETKIPVFKEVRGKDWIFYGNNNLYPNELIDLFSRSTTHNTIVNSKSEYISGQGLRSKSLNVSERMAFDIFNNTFTSGTVDSLFAKVALDNELFNGFALQMIPTKKGGWTAYHVSFSRIRANEDRTTFYYSEDWSKYRQDAEDTGFKEYPAFDKDKKKESILYFVNYRPKNGMDTYPTPNYLPATPYIECDYQIANFHVNNLRNGFTGSTIINFFNGEPTPEEQKKIEQKLKRKFSGTDNAGGVILVFSDSKSKEPLITNIQPSDFDKQFDILNKTVESKIFIAHSVTSPALMGVMTGASLNQNKDELKDAFAMFNETYITTRRNKILAVFNDFAQMYGVAQGLEVKDYNPFKFTLSDADVSLVLTPEEKRKWISENLSVALINNSVPPTQMSTHVECAHDFAEADEDSVLQVFSEYGVPADNYSFIRTKFVHKRRPIKFEDVVTVEISKEDGKVLSAIKGNPKGGINEIADAVKLPSETVLEIVNKLQEDGLLDTDGTNYKITSAGNKMLKQNNVLKIKSMYQYALSPYLKGQPAVLPDDRTRPFCEKLIGLNKLYTRNELSQISQRVYGDENSVWVRRGGFYRNPTSGETTPFCRHVWALVTVIEK
jgi:DNA-binding Lrp family transcriptional regulator